MKFEGKEGLFSMILCKNNQNCKEKFTITCICPILDITREWLNQILYKHIKLYIYFRPFFNNKKSCNGDWLHLKHLKSRCFPENVNLCWKHQGEQEKLLSLLFHSALVKKQPQALLAWQSVLNIWLHWKTPTANKKS